MAINDDHILANNDWGIAAVFQDIALQRRKLLSAERREQLFHLRQDDRRPFRAAIFDFCVLQSTISFSLFFVSLRRKFAVLSNPVPDRQPCSALCRASSLGPLVQTEVMAGFPAKVSDWTVIYFYPERVSTQDTAKTC